MKAKPVILVVDDLPENIELIEAYLAGQGYEIVTAANGEDALEIISGYQIDLILLDVMMPGIDGFDVTRRVRQDDAHRLLPIIMVTSLHEREDRVKGIEAGCDDFISKPVDKMELLARVRSSLKVKAYNDLMKNYRNDLELEVAGRTEELKHALENLRQDIKERKRAEESLHESEAFLKATGHMAKVGGWEIDTANLDLNWTEETYRIHELPFGHKPKLEEAINYYHPDERQKLSDSIQRALKYGETYDMELRFISAKGKHLWTRSICFPESVDGKIVKLRGTFQDITDRKQAEEKLLESKTLFEAVVENIPLMIFLKEATDLRFVIFNRAGEELLGHDRKDLLGKNNLDLFPPEQAAHFMAKDREVLNGKAIVMDIPEEQIQTAKKGQRLLHTKKVCIRSTDGTTKYLLGISEDITERKQEEEKLQRTLDSLSKAFSTIVQVLISAIEMRDPYTAGHQLRVAHLACAIATEMELAKEKIDGIRMAGSIHDIGKLAVPSEVLSKPTKLTKIEFSLIQEHSQSGYDMLKDVESPWPLAEIVYQHHERMNGSGYPRNLKGDEILLDARIMAVADVVEAMASHRPYRPALGIDVALEEIEKNKGILYDNVVADACLRLFREKDYKMLIS